LLPVVNLRYVSEKELHEFRHPMTGPHRCLITDADGDHTMSCISDVFLETMVEDLGRTATEDEITVRRKNYRRLSRSQRLTLLAVRRSHRERKLAATESCGRESEWQFTGQKQSLEAADAVSMEKSRIQIDTKETLQQSELVRERILQEWDVMLERNRKEMERQYEAMAKSLAALSERLNWLKQSQNKLNQVKRRITVEHQDYRAMANGMKGIARYDGSTMQTIIAVLIMGHFVVFGCGRNRNVGNNQE